jgi:hypothetical protein
MPIGDFSSVFDFRVRIDFEGKLNIRRRWADDLDAIKTLAAPTCGVGSKYLNPYGFHSILFRPKLHHTWLQCRYNLRRQRELVSIKPLQSRHGVGSNNGLTIFLCWILSSQCGGQNSNVSSTRDKTTNTTKINPQHLKTSKINGIFLGNRVSASHAP